MEQDLEATCKKLRQIPKHDPDYGMLAVKAFDLSGELQRQGIQVTMTDDFELRWY